MNSCQAFLGVVSNTIFGSLFLYYLNNEEKNNGCTEKSFLFWSYFTAVYCLLSAILFILTIASIQCLQLSLQSRKILLAASFIVSILGCVCPVLLWYYGGESCGDLHTLAQVFYLYIFIGFLILFLIQCYICCNTSYSTVSVQDQFQKQDQYYSEL